MTSPEDPEQRIADLEKQVADARRIADLQQQLAEAQAESHQAQQAQQPQQTYPGRRMSDIVGAFGTGRGTAPAAPLDTRLSDAPRRIPLAFVLADLLPFRWWYVFALFMVAVPPIALWITNPRLLGPAAVVTVLAIYAVQSRAARKRHALLKWGRVAQVTGADVISQGTYYSGTTYSNVWLPQAHGWTVSRDLSSGGSTKTKVGYVLDGHAGDLVLGGRPYVDGVVLADPRHPERALCVSSFPYDLDRDENGNWTGRLRTRLKVGMVAWILVVAAWLTVAFGISTGVVGRLVTEVSADRISAGGTSTVNGNGTTKTVYCDGGSLVVKGNRNVVTVHGRCDGLTVSGIDGVITIDSVDTIKLSGIDNHVTYHSGTPKVTTGGINNVARLG